MLCFTLVKKSCCGLEGAVGPPVVRKLLQGFDAEPHPRPLYLFPRVLAPNFTLSVRALALCPKFVQNACSLQQLLHLFLIYFVMCAGLAFSNVFHSSIRTFLNVTK